MTTKKLATMATDLAGALGARMEVDKNNGKNAPKGEKEKKVMKKRTKKTPATNDTAPEVVQPATLPVPVPPAQPTPAISLEDQIMAARQKLHPEEVKAKTKSAYKLATGKVTSMAFVEAILEADTLLIHDGIFNSKQSEEEVLNSHYELSYHDLKAKLGQLDGDAREEAQNILELLAKFELSPRSIVDSLWKMVVEIVRPAEQVDNVDDLADLMTALNKDEIVVSEPKPHNYRDDHAVVIARPNNSFAYSPRTTTAKTGWDWMKKAEVRVKARAKTEVADRAKKFAELKGREVQISLSQAKAGEDGYVFVEIGRGENRGALLHIEDERIQIVDTVGIEVKPITKLLRWDASYGAWPMDAKDIYHALFAWRNAKFSQPPKAS